MKDKKSVIQRVRDKQQPISNHIAEITGQQYVTKPYYYRHEETGEEYYTITGAMGWSSDDRPGFAVIVAALKSVPKEPTFKVLQETESNDMAALVTACIQTRNTWGYPYLLDLWYGDPLRFSTFLSDFNETYERNNDDGGFYLAPPDDFEQQNRTEIYLERIKSLLKPGEDGKKHLVLGPCDKLRSQLHNLPSDARKIEIEDFPAVSALAYAVHSLMATRTWLQFLEPEYKIPTIDDHLQEEFYGADDNFALQYDEMGQTSILI